MSSRRRKLGRRVVVAILFTFAIVGYGVVLLEARIARNDVMDSIPYTGQLAFEPTGSMNVALYPQYGFADLGEDFRLPMSATWALGPVEPANVSGASVMIIGDEPLLYSPTATVRVFFCGREVGRIDARAVGSRTGPFVPNLPRRLVQAPPEEAFGYEFPVGEANCRERSDMMVRGTSTTWRIYRIGVVGETSRFFRSAL